MSAVAPLAGVMGWPVDHSLSPVLHHHWLDRMGLSGHYVPLAVRPQHLAEALFDLHKLGFRGVNLTIPHKQSAARLVKRLDPAAKRIGAINTVLVDDRGGLFGLNTDAGGFVAALKAGATGFDPTGAAVLILGAGGAARAVVAGLLDVDIGTITVVNRTPRHAESLVADFADRRLETGAWGERTHRLKDCDLVVNTTSLGMKGQPPLDLDLSLLSSEAMVADLVYTPLVTDLLARARARGLRTLDGLGMLIHQGAEAFRQFYGQAPPLDGAVRSALVAHMGEAEA